MKLCTETAHTIVASLAPNACMKCSIKKPNMDAHPPLRASRKNEENTTTQPHPPSEGPSVTMIHVVWVFPSSFQKDQVIQYDGMYYP